MSISWEGFGAIWSGKPASCASAGKVLGLFGEASQHHEHQLGRFWRHLGRQASIMSISWEGFGAVCKSKAAASASAGKALGLFGEASQHHAHQLGRFWLYLGTPASGA